ncbi:MAG: NuoF family protein, partial [Desulfobacterales bacterium]
MTPAARDISNQPFQALRAEALRRRAAFDAAPMPKIHIGMATCGIAAGALETRAAFEQALAERGIEARIHPVGCCGHCYAEPVVVIDNPAAGFPPIFYPEVNAGKAAMLTKLFLEGGDPRLEHILGATIANDLIPSVMEYPRFNREKRIVMEKCGRIDPEDIFDYLAEGGYGALAAALERPPADIVAEIEQSGLRGRGGAGFPTGTKWDLARRAGGNEKIIICNADEGDPGAYMDRTILESNPHQVLEGMIICAYAVGASRGIVYVRSEYPLAVRIARRAIAQARENGLLGADILGRGIDFDIVVFEGSGAFVCGEETALIQSIEGRRGMPLHRPPYPVEAGLNGRPTVINNVKTLASVPPVIENGAAWYRGIGSPDSPGTAIFSVVGNVTHPGLVEIPMGVSLRTLIFDICGGIPNKKKFKAVQIGGPSGGCLSEDFLDTPIDFDSLTAAGAMMGSGGMVVMDEDTCLVDVARYFLDFTQKESCGKCTFCRIGTHHLLEILERLTKGEGRPSDPDLLRQLSEDMQLGSLCGLGRTASNPVLTSLRYFADDYTAHVEQQRCPAMMCRPLTAFYIDLDRCARGCDACVGCCPVDAVFT